ncbi:radical SAM protein [Nocardia arizonensis]|uniref:radical SAM protein n=1 Tax=Nocardia arizonensis TaxID=1141647 RepID=UPI0009EA5568|nr:radical SAM protein [Nocardia arizonensis]
MSNPREPMSAESDARASTRRPLPILSPAQLMALDPRLQRVIDYRKSGLSLNWIVGCPLDCTYCVRHTFGNYEMKVPRRIMDEPTAARMLLRNKHFRPHVTPIQLLNRATDPMLPAVKPHTLDMLRLLDDQGITNHVLVITRWRIEPEDCAVLNSFSNIRLTILVTHSGIDDSRIEPVDSDIAATSLRTAFEYAENYRVILYWRPIVPGLNDSDSHLERARDLSHHAHATVFTGLFFKDQIREYYITNGLPELYDEGPSRKIFPERLEQRILVHSSGFGSPLFRKTSCGVTYAHGVADYNGHYGVRELCDICPLAQVQRCAVDWRRPDLEPTTAWVERLGGRMLEITDRAVIVEGLPEGRRNFLQHNLGYQVNDRHRPHHIGRHGRADIGWTDQEAAR